MQLHPALIQLFQKPPAHPSTQWGGLKDILEAQRQAYGTYPGENQFNGVINPGEMPNSRVIDPDDFMLNLGQQQSSNQDDYLPNLPEMINEPNQERFNNMLEMLKRYRVWREGENP